MNTVKYRFEDSVKISGSKYIFQSITKQKLSNIHHCHDFYEVFIILRGNVSHRINSIAVTMKEGDCVILTPGDTHCFVMQSDNLEIIALSIHYDEFLSMASIYSSQLADANKAVFFSCTDRLNDLQSQAKRCCLGILDNENKLLLSMLLCTYSALEQKQHIKIPHTLTNAIAVMGSDSHIKGGIPVLVQLTNYSYSHLYRLVKQYYGTTPHQLILRLKLDTAYSKLIHSDISVEQIAESVGFQSVSHFIKAFKARFGSSPAKLRSQNKSVLF